MSARLCCDLHMSGAVPDEEACPSRTVIVLVRWLTERMNQAEAKVEAVARIAATARDKHAGDMAQRGRGRSAWHCYDIANSLADAIGCERPEIEP